jgi:molybdopterin-guanine dinucleotide biosynthesis protein B
LQNDNEQGGAAKPVVFALVGNSGSGKTTLIAALIRRYVEEGRRVGAIKHTHHELNDADRGDTRLFREAGADPVVLASDREAVVFEGDQRKRVPFANLGELLGLFHTDFVIVEGFKSLHSWPAIEIETSNRPTLDELAAIVDRIERP